MPEQPLIQRWIGLDIHKAFFVAVGVDAEKRTVFGPHKIPNEQLENWIAKHLLSTDAVVMEMTTNTYLFYDTLLPHVGSVIAVHPPNVRLVTGVKVKTDKKAALTLAQLHAAGLLEGVWIPPDEVRELRAVIAQRSKMVRLQTQAKNRLTSLLHRTHRERPAQSFKPELKAWWEALPLSTIEKYIVASDLETLAFAEKQIQAIGEVLCQEAAKDERVPLLTQLPGIAMLMALTILAAIGPIERFEDASHLVGYAGLGASVHDSGQMHATGHITKAGRRDLRGAMVDAANAAVRHHPFWKKEFERLEYRLGRSKAIVAIARRLLVAVWHILTNGVADRHADVISVAASMYKLAYEIKLSNLPKGVSSRAFTRQQLDRLGIGQDLEVLPRSGKKVKLPPSQLKT
ncbi:MAG: IS110 family transposase [Anaerolineales bacterium]|jgi:transposase